MNKNVKNNLSFEQTNVKVRSEKSTAFFDNFCSEDRKHLMLLGKATAIKLIADNYNDIIEIDADKELIYKKYVNKNINIIYEKTWEDLYNNVVNDFGMLEFSKEIFAPLKNHPFSKVAYDRIYNSLEILNEYMEARNNAQENKVREISDQYFRNGKHFSDESASNRAKFGNIFTFRSIDGKIKNASWHGKINVGREKYRVYFEYPLENTRKKLEIFYIGPKLKNSTSPKKIEYKSGSLKNERQKSTWTMESRKSTWQEAIGMSDQSAFEFYESVEQVQSTYAFDIRKIMKDFDLEGVFCVDGKPEAIVIRREKYKVDEIQKVSEAIWNQGLASVLVIVEAKVIQIFSLLKKFSDSGDNEFVDKYLIKEVEFGIGETLNDFFFALQNGRMFHENSEVFDPDAQSANVFLKKLSNAYSKLVHEEKLNSNEATALLIQAIFIAFLEDRQFLSEEFISNTSNSKCKKFSELLESGDVVLFDNFITRLKKLFNDDLFFSAHSLNELNSNSRLKPSAMNVLLHFRHGENETRKKSAFRLNFRYSPISLISEAYSHLTNLSKNNGIEVNSSLTPLSIVDYTLNSMWKNIDKRAIKGARILDPNCGSGSFLVRTFQKICLATNVESGNSSFSWTKLKNTVKRVHGFGLEESELRIALFSLYVSMLDFAPTPVVKRLLNNSIKLPKLWNETLLPYHYFDVPSSNSKFDLIIGMPLWNAKSSFKNPISKWCGENGRKLPHGQIALAYVWKSMQDLEQNGIAALLLPASNLLHENTKASESARKSLFEEFNVLQVTDFSDFRRQLFNSNENAGALIVAGTSLADSGNSEFLYADPKSDMKSLFDQSINVRSIDCKWLSNSVVYNNPSIFTNRLWMNTQEMKLFMFLYGLPRLSDSKSGMGVKKQKPKSAWTIGVGLQNYRNSAYSPDRCRMNVVIGKEPTAFQDNFCKITIPNCDSDHAKFLAAFLSSRFAFWWIFHTTASIKSKFSKLKESEILNIPCPMPDAFHKVSLLENAKYVKQKIVSVANQIEDIHNSNNGITTMQFISNEKNSYEKLKKIDKLVYEYMDLTENEIILIEDALNYNLPAISPSLHDSPKLWQYPTHLERKAFAHRLIKCLSRWIVDGNAMSIELTCRNDDYAVLRLYMSDVREKRDYVEFSNQKLTEVLNNLISSSGNDSLKFQHNSDSRIYNGDFLYLIKPMQYRYWLESIAVEDAMKIALDFQSYMVNRQT